MGSLTAALVDEARVVRMVGAAARVEGRTPMVDEADDWMPARLVPGTAGEREVDGRRYVTERAQLVLVPHADVRASDRIEIRSPLLGESTWSIVGQPRVAASRLSVRALTVPLERIVEPVRESDFS